MSDDGTVDIKVKVIGQPRPLHAVKVIGQPRPLMHPSIGQALSAIREVAMRHIRIERS